MIEPPFAFTTKICNNHKFILSQSQSNKQLITIIMDKVGPERSAQYKLENLLQVGSFHRTQNIFIFY